MTDILKPRDGADVEEAVRWALANDKTLEVVGQGSKRTLGRPSQTDMTLDLSGLSGVTLYKSVREQKGLGFHPMQVTCARQLYVARDETDKQEALKRQAAYTKRTVDVSRTPGKAGSHVLAYAERPGATEEHALFGTPDEIAGMLEALRQNGVHYVLLTIAGGIDQLRRFAREIMPAFASEPATRAAE